MAGHVVKIITDQDGMFVARCACRQISKRVPMRWQAEDWEREHLDYIEKVKAHLGTRTPSLKSQRDYYRSKAEDPSVSAAEREQWAMLADGLDRRVGDREYGEEPMLW
jgi:hypothetical protein